MAVTHAPPRRLVPGQRKQNRRRLLGAIVLVVLAVGGLIAWGLAPAGAPGAPPPSLGNAADVALPASVVQASLVDQQGKPVTLAAYRGHIVVLVPFLTSCQEECPITTAALLSVRRALVAAGLGTKVDIVEASVDPGRDVPTRLALYAALTRTSWPLVTGPPDTMAAIWRHFGVYAQPVPEGVPAGIDWQTGRSYTYDVDHTDGFILIGPNLHERFVTSAAADLGGRSLDPPLARLLDGQGLSDVRHPPSGSWTVAQALSAIGWLAGRDIPAAS